MNEGRWLLVTEGVLKGDAAAAAGLVCIALNGVWNWRGTTYEGAKIVLPDWEYVHLEDRSTLIVFDSDVSRKRAVQRSLERLGAVLTRRGADLGYVYLPDGNGKVGLDDWLAAGHDPKELVDLASNEPVGLPTVVFNGRQLRDVSRDVVDGVERSNEPPQVFRRATHLVRVGMDTDDVPVIEMLDGKRLRQQANLVMDFARATVNRKGETKYTQERIPLDFMADVLAMGTWPYPVLDGITRTPALRPDGSVLWRSGYDPATRLVYAPDKGLVVPPVPAEPTVEEVVRALALLNDAFGDFRYVDDAARANAYALALTPILRPAISGPVPLALMDAPQAGSGKTLFAQATGMVATGRPGETTPAPTNEEEWRKKITSLLVQGASIITFDNIEGALQSASLALALTSDSVTDRLLGGNEVVTLRQRATWIATGNNLTVGGDLPRRCYWVRLDPQDARPWLSNDWKHPDLLEWIGGHRGELIAALLTLARSWFVAGQPKADTRRLGSYGEWCRVIGGVLQHVGIDGFLDNAEQMYNIIDEETARWEGFLLAWHDRYGDRLIFLSELQEDLYFWEPLKETLPPELGSPNQGDFKKRAGIHLKAKLDHRHGDEGWFLTRKYDNHKKVWLWTVRADGRLRDGGAF